MKEKKDLNVQIGERIKKSREAVSLTQEKFSEMVGVSVQYVSDLERGKVGTSISTLVKICRVLHVPSDYILFGESKTGEVPAVLDRLEGLSDKQIEIVEDAVCLLLRAFAEK